jgi:hypothetical protein
VALIEALDSEKVLFAGFGVGTWADNIRVINIKTNVKMYFFIKFN